MANKKWSIVGVAVLAGVVQLSLSSDTSSSNPRRPLYMPDTAPTYVPDEIIVKFRAGTTLQNQRSVIASVGDRHVHGAMGGGYALVKLPAGRTVESALQSYSALGDIEYAQPNFIYRYFAVPNDASYGQLWGLKNTGQTVSGATYGTNNPGAAGRDMDLELAWDQITDCRSVIVAVLDSGMNYTHQDLAANMWDGSAVGYPNHGYDFFNNDNDPMATDALGHATHVAGTIGAVGNNGFGTTGVCWNAKIIAVRVGDSLVGVTTAGVIQGLNFAVNHGAKVVNMSFGGPGFDQAFANAIEDARQNGVVIVVAAGNSQSGSNNDARDSNGNLISPIYPCNFTHDNIICVAALDQSYSHARFSNFGSTSVDVGAPGTNILSSWPGTTITDGFSSGWTLMGGWLGVSCDFGIGPVRMLVNPTNWCAAGLYANNANDVAYKSFNLGAASYAQVSFLRFRDMASGDFLGFAKRAAGGDPFAAGGTVITQETGNIVTSVRLSLDDCRTATCTFGFRLQSDAVGTDFGAGIWAFTIDTTQLNGNVHQVLDGTSMASPHVAGLAAMIKAYNPSYTYADIVSSVKFGGESVASLSGVTTTGRAVNAMGSLRYIQPPANVNASVTLR